VRLYGSVNGVSTLLTKQNMVGWLLKHVEFNYISITDDSNVLLKFFQNYHDFNHLMNAHETNGGDLFNYHQPRAKNNIFISQQCTRDLKNYVDGGWTNVRHIYYRLDYCLALALIDGAYLVHRDFVLIDVHPFTRNGRKLYVLVVPNSKMHVDQKWKIKDHKQIQEVFMTDVEVSKKYNIPLSSLPDCSGQRKYAEEELKKIVISETLIMSTDWSKIEHKQSKRQWKKFKSSLSGTSTNAHSLQINIGTNEFATAVADALKRYGLHQMVHIITMNGNKYHFELLLPVHLKKFGKIVAVTFYFDPLCGQTKVGAILLDHQDMFNKAGLCRNLWQCDALRKAHPWLFDVVNYSKNSACSVRFRLDSNKAMSALQSLSQVPLQQPMIISTMYIDPVSLQSYVLATVVYC
jgi:hypothetical protein